MGILPCLEWHLCYNIGIAVVFDHDVLVSTVGTDRETTRAVSIQFTDGRDLDKELVLSDLGQRLLRRNGMGRIWSAGFRGLRLGRPYALTFLENVPHDGGFGGREIIGCVGEVKAWPRLVVTFAYVLETCGPD